MGSTQIRSRVQERQDILKLVAKSEGASGLIRTAARPDAATERLIQQPTIHHEIEGIVRCADLYRAQRVVPEPRAAPNRILHVCEARVASHEFRCTRQVGTFTKHERDL